MKMKSLMALIASAVVSLNVIAQSQPVSPTPATPNPDLSMLTNHAALVAYCFKQVQGIAVNVSSGSEVSPQGQRFYSFTNSVKTLEGIAATFTNDWWDFQVTSPTDSISFSVTFYNTNDWNTIQNNQWVDQNSSQLFYGNNYSQPVMSPYGYWTLPASAETAAMFLNPTIKIKDPNTQLSAVRLIARDSNGNPYPVDMSVDGDSFFFDTQYAGNGTLVISGWYQTSPGYWQWFQNGYSLGNGAPVQLSWIEIQALVSGSSDFASYKDTNNLTTPIWTWTDYNNNEYGTIPLEIATFTQPTTNVVLNTYTSYGHYATSYLLENQQTKVKTTVTVPVNATSVTTGTNALQGVYYIIPMGINLQDTGSYVYAGGGKG